MQSGKFALRMGTQRARVRTPSVKITVAVFPGAWGVACVYKRNFETTYVWN